MANYTGKLKGVRNPEMRALLTSLFGEVDDQFDGETPINPAIEFLSAAPVAAVAAYVDITAANVDAMSDGETLTFAGETFTFVDTEQSAEAGTFEDVAGLILAVNELLGDDWTAAEQDGTDCRITADVKGTAWNGYEVASAEFTNVETENGVDNTPAKKGQLFFHGTTIYFPAADVAVSDDLTNWKKIESADHA